MKCRRCSKEIPGGSKHCEYCGTFQKTYIKLNDRREDQMRTKKVKANAVVFIIMAVIIIAVVIVSSTMADRTRRNHLEDIREGYAWLSAEAEPTQDDIDAFNITVGRYIAKYPKSKEVAEIEKYHAEINGYDPELAELQREYELEDLRQQEQYFIENAKSTIIQIGDVYCRERQDSGAFDLVVSWANNSSQTVDSVSFMVEAYDENGDIIKNSEGKNRLSASTQTGPFGPSNPDSYYQNTWMSAWPQGSEIYSVELVQVAIYYENGNPLVLNENITPYLR